MIVIGRKKLEKFKRKHSDAKGQIDVWLNETVNTTWQGPKDIKARYPHSSILSGNRVIFNIKGSKYRLIVIVRYVSETVYVEWIGTHAQYSRMKFD